NFPRPTPMRRSSCPRMPARCIARWMKPWQGERRRMSDETKRPEWRLATKAIHGPERVAKAHHSVITPIVQTSNFSFDTTAELVEFMTEKQKGRTIREVEYA